MALKRKITKEAYDKLDKIIQSEYSLDGSDYILEVDGLEDTGALSRAHERQKIKNKELTAALEKAEADLEAVKSVDVKKLEEQWTAKHTKEIENLNNTIGKLTNFAKSSLADKVAEGLAKEISTVPSLMLPAIKSRIIADLEGDSPVTKILDKEGKPSTMTLDDLKKELLDNTEFAPILVGNRARGSNAKPVTTNANGDKPLNNQQNRTGNSVSTNPKDLVAMLDAKKK